MQTIELVRQDGTVKQVSVPKNWNQAQSLIVEYLSSGEFVLAQPVAI